MGATAIKRVAIYTRVSTDEQDDAMQLAALRDYARRREITVGGVEKALVQG